MNIADQVQFGKQWLKMAREEGHRKGLPRMVGPGSEQERMAEKNRDTIIAAISEKGPMTVRGIADAIGKHPDRIRAAVRNMASTGWLEETGAVPACFKIKQRDDEVTPS